MIKLKTIRQRRPGHWSLVFFHEGELVYLQKNEKEEPLTSKDMALALKDYLNKYGYNPQLFPKRNQRKPIIIFDKLSEKDKDQIREEHFNRCDICGSNTIKNKKIAIDHDHKDNSIRGVLCHKCNTILAFAKDDVRILAKAIVYLTTPPEPVLKRKGKRFRKGWQDPLTKFPAVNTDKTAPF
jgi:uncharacterized C2H2 Zn-finger protein